MYSKVEESFEGESILPKNTTHSFIQGLNSDVSIRSPAHIMLDHYKKIFKKIYACLENPTPSPHNFSDGPSLRPARPGIYFLFIVISLFFPSAKCLSSLSSLPASSLSSEYGPLLNCLCSWDRTTDVLELINDLIASRMTGQRKDIKMVLNCVVNCFCFQFEVVSKFNEICTRKPKNSLYHRKHFFF